jgi:hypothetical protein
MTEYYAGRLNGSTVQAVFEGLIAEATGSRDLGCCVSPVVFCLDSGGRPNAFHYRGATSGGFVRCPMADVREFDVGVRTR